MLKIVDALISGSGAECDESIIATSFVNCDT